MTKRSPRPRTTRRGKRPVEAPPDQTTEGPSAAVADELPSIILADDLLAEPPPEPDLEALARIPLPEPPDAPDLAARVADPPPAKDGPSGPPEPSDLTAPADEALPAQSREQDSVDGEAGDAWPPGSETTAERDDEAAPEAEPEPPEPARPAPLARVPLAPRPPAQRYAPAYDDSAPIEIPRYVEEAPRRAWRPPEPARPAAPSEPPPWKTAHPEPDDDLELDLRANRRKYNWLLVLACVIVAILGVLVGSRPGEQHETSTSPTSADDTTASPDVLADAMPDTSPTGTDDAPADAEAPDTAPRLARPDVSPPPPKAARALDEAKRALDERRWDGALLELDKALAEAPNNPRALFARARALDQVGKTDEALRDLDAVLAIDPGHPYALLLAGEALDKQGKATEARAFYDRYLASWPKTRKAEELRKRFGLPAPK